MAGEFDLIARYFDWPALGEGVDLGVGDDAALLSVQAKHQLAISVDTLVSGVHFPVDTSPVDVGYKALTVNVSDMAAMGAEPQWFTLALTLPEYSPDWLSAFSSGLRLAAETYGVDLIGGDTTRGSLTMTIQIMGEVKPSNALQRSAAKIGDVIYISNTLGDAAAGLQVYHQHLAKGASAHQNELTQAQKHCLMRLNRPAARVAESRIIRQFANACIDVSDGLLQDLSHILKASGVGATLSTDTIQYSAALNSLYTRPECLSFALSGGDDYELLFTVASEHCDDFERAMSDQAFSYQAVGLINEDTGIITNHQKELLTTKGFQHF